MSLEELMGVEVTTVSKTVEELLASPAAVYVIGDEEIRRSGLRSIPELLRLVPGMEVARIDANMWAITARGFNGRFANKLLVMIDGRTVYTPLFSGVFWDVQDVLLEDVERIEVVRGPGGALWGANAVNGVINIITKKAGDTQGWYAEGGAGSDERGLASARFGGRSGNLAYRAFGRFFDHDGFVIEDGTDAADQWHLAHGGFRLDWDAAGPDSLALSGDLYDGETGKTTRELSSPFPIDSTADLSGGNALLSWRHTFAAGSATELRVDYDRTRRLSVDSETRDTFDIDIQHVWQASRRHQIAWGGGYRVTRSSDLSESRFPGGGRTLDLANAFVQDRIALSPDWSLVLGSKLEHNDFTGFEVQPGARIVWSAQQRWAAWGAISRAVRTPSEAESFAEIQAAAGVNPANGLPIVALFAGNPDLAAETLLAYEAGFRARPRDWLSLDVAAFYNDYDDIIRGSAGQPSVRPLPPPPHILLPVTGANTARGHGAGIEVASRWQLRPAWRVEVDYSYLDLDLSGAGAVEPFELAGASPHHQAKLKSMATLAGNVELDAFLYVVGRLESFDIDTHARLDLHLGWRPAPAWQVDVVGQDLLKESHTEFGSSALGEVPTRMQRGAYGTLTWRH